MTGALRILCALGGHLLRWIARLFVGACGLVLALARACERGARP